MDEHVLGLKVVRIKEGYQDLLEINGDPSWTKKVWDIRRDLPSGTNTENGKTALLLTGIDSGTILTIAACIEGRPNDCISAWVFVPSRIEVTGKQLVEIIDETKEELVANVRDDIRLHQIFERAYSVSDAVKSTVVCSGNQLAYRRYGRGCGYELYELLNNPDQSEYRKYKGVFLIDSASGIIYNGQDLSSFPLKEFVKVNPVADIHGFKASIEGHPLTRAIFLPEGDHVTVTWQRAGYEKKEKNWIVSKNEPVPTVCDSDYFVLVPYNRFVVKDHGTGQLLHDYSIRINDKRLQEWQPMPVHESIVTNSDITVYADGYTDYRHSHDLNQEKIPIYLSKKKYSKDYHVPLSFDKNHYGTLHVETETRFSRSISPVRGYVQDPYNEGYLIYKPFGKRPKRMIVVFFVIAILLGFILGSIVAGSDKKKPISNPPSSLTPKTSSSPSKEADRVMDITKAIEYLDQNKTWNRDSMEAFPVLQGLWDAMNDRDFDKVLDKADSLKMSSSFQKLVEAIQNNREKEFGRYTQDGDISISVERYIKSLNNAKFPQKQVHEPSEKKGKTDDDQSKY